MRYHDRTSQLLTTLISVPDAPDSFDGLMDYAKKPNISDYFTADHVKTLFAQALACDAKDNKYLSILHCLAQHQNSEQYFNVELLKSLKKQHEELEQDVLSELFGLFGFIFDFTKLNFSFLSTIKTMLSVCQEKDFESFEKNLHKAFLGVITNYVESLTALDEFLAGKSLTKDILKIYDLLIDAYQQYTHKFEAELNALQGIKPQTKVAENSFLNFVNSVNTSIQNLKQNYFLPIPENSGVSSNQNLISFAELNNIFEKEVIPTFCL